VMVLVSFKFFQLHNLWENQFGVSQFRTEFHLFRNEMINKDGMKAFFDTM